MGRNADGQPNANLDRLEAVFFAALERPAHERDAYVRDACGDDAGLRARVETMLAADAAVAGPVDTAPWSAAQVARGATESGLADDPVARPGATIGRYRLVRPLGAGGMGTVWLARRADEHFEQRAAVKIIKRGLETAALLRRFRRERQVLARLEHPNIARLIDGGSTEDGRPYLVMELVEGVPIDRFCAERRLDVRGRVRLFEQVCEAVAYAHRSLVVHRDLKPGNILVDADGAPKLLDFGVAKVLEPEDGGAAMTMTVARERLLTPRYASPEQVRGEAMTTTTDVYALGVILYELLVGKPPYELDTKSTAEIERVVCEVEPTRPSSAVRGDEAAAPDRTRRLRRTLRGDLDVIVLRALHKDPSRRYGSVDALREDLERWRAGEPVEARPDSWAYRTRRFVGRHRAGVAAAAIVALLLVAAAVVSSAFAVRASRARANAEWKAYVSTIAAAQAAIEARGDPVDARAFLLSIPESMRGWEWRYLWRSRRSGIRAVRCGRNGVSVAFSPDDRRIAAGIGASGAGGWVTIVDTTTGEITGESARIHSTSIWSLAFSRDGSRIWTASPGAIAIVDAATLDVLSRHDLPVPGAGTVIAVGPDDGLTAIGLGSGAVVVLGPDGAPRWSVADAHATQVRGLAFDAAGAVLVSAGRDGRVRRWDAATGAALGDLVEHDAPFEDVVLIDDDALVAVSADGRLWRWSWPDGAIIEHDFVMQRRTEPSRTLAPLARLSPDGRHGAFPGPRVFPVGSDTEPWRIMAGAPNDWRFSGDGTKLATIDWAGQVTLLDVTGSPSMRRCEDGEFQTWLRAATDDGGLLATAGGDDGTVRLREGETGLLLDVLDSGAEAVRSLALDAAGDRLLAGTESTLRVWRLPERTIVLERDGARGAHPGADLDRAGRRVAWAGTDDLVHVEDLETGDAFTLGPFAVPPMRCVFDPSGRRIAVSAWGRWPDGRNRGTITVWDVEHRRRYDRSLRLELRTYDVEFSPDGDSLFGVFHRNECWSWRWRTDDRARRRRHQPERGSHSPRHVAISADGSRLAPGAGTSIALQEPDRLDTAIDLRAGRLRDVGFGAGDRWLQAASDHAGLITYDTQSVGDGLPALEIRRAWQRLDGDLPAIRAAIAANHWLDADGHAAAEAILDRIDRFHRTPWTADRDESPDS